VERDGGYATPRGGGLHLGLALGSPRIRMAHPKIPLILCISGTSVGVEKGGGGGWVRAHVSLHSWERQGV
jgi:hypothetical protein